MLLLKERGLIKSMEYNSFTRIHHDDKEIKIVKQMPTIASNKQPTIAIITAQYCEKLAVDAMLENKETFVRYTTVGTNFCFNKKNLILIRFEKSVTFITGRCMLCQVSHACG